MSRRGSRGTPAAIGAAVLALAILVPGLLAACGLQSPGAAWTPGRLRIVTTTSIFADFVSQVGGDRVSVVSLVPKGGEVHTYDPRPSVLALVDEAQLVVMNGLGLDDWLARIVTNVGTAAPIVRLGEALPGATYLGEDPNRPNPHLWLNAAYAREYVARIEAALAALEPASADRFAAAATAYDAQLAAVDGWARTTLGSIPAADRVVVSFHDALPYFASAYGLTIVGVVVRAPGQDPSAGEVASLLEAIRSAGARAVFSEAQFSPELANSIALEAGARVVSDLYTDTLGDPPVDSYLGLIRWDVQRVAEALA